MINLLSKSDVERIEKTIRKYSNLLVSVKESEIEKFKNVQKATNSLSPLAEMSRILHEEFLAEIDGEIKSNSDLLLFLEGENV